MYIVELCHLQAIQHMLGPKQFPLSRLLAIFYTIAGSQVQPSMNIFSQVLCVNVCNVAVLFGYRALFCRLSKLDSVLKFSIKFQTISCFPVLTFCHLSLASSNIWLTCHSLSENDIFHRIIEIYRFLLTI